jgi:hypothetical protein
MTAVAAIALALAATPAFAQGAGQTQVNTGLGIGALGGLSWTQIRTENETNAEFASDTGWLFGIWFGGNRDGRAGLMGELNYATKKITVTGAGPEESVERTYVQLPVLLRINAGYRERDKPSVYLLVGPVFDIQIKAKVNGADSPDDVYEGLDIGVMAGVGFEVVRLGIEGRYSWGLKSVLATDAAVAEGFGSTKNNTFSVVAKVRFN